MSDLLIGTVGWRGDDWQDGYYPEELPEDWRFCYYSNNLRTVLLPASEWISRTEEEISDWPEDCDPGFRFVIEFALEVDGGGVEAGGAEDAVAAFAQKVAGIGEQWDAVLLTVPGVPGEAWLTPWLEALLALRPVCIQLTENQVAPPWLAKYPVTVCWDTGVSAAPVSSMVQNTFLVALTEEAAPRKQRVIIESLMAWMAGQRGAALFFRGKQAATRAENARLIGEMLGA